MPIVTCALGPDSAGALLQRFLVEGGGHLEAAVYEVGPYYAPLFRAAAGAGRRTRLLLDGHPGANATTGRLLAGGAVSCRYLRGPTGTAAHWKLLIGGGDRLAVGSGNLIKRDAPRDPAGLVPPDLARPGPGTREWWVFVESASRLAGEARTEFERAWAVAGPAPAAWRRERGTAPPVGIPLPLLAPLRLAVEDRRLGLLLGGFAIAGNLRRLLRGARRRVLVTVPYANPGSSRVRDLLGELSRASRRGAVVRLLLGQSPRPEVAAELLQRVGELRVMDPVRRTAGHAKGAVVDDRVLVGSGNWSGAGLGGNREAALLVEDGRAAAYYADAFQRDWQLSLELPGLVGRGAAVCSDQPPVLGAILEQ